MIDITTATEEQLLAELDRIGEEGYEASMLMEVTPDFTPAMREVESQIFELRAEQRRVGNALRALRGLPPIQSRHARRVGTAR